MSATKAQINWTAVEFASTPITRVTNASVGQGGSLIKFKGDTDLYPTIIANVDNEPHMSITTADVGNLMTIVPGTAGTLTATLNDAKVQPAVPWSSHSQMPSSRTPTLRPNTRSSAPSPGPGRHIAQTARPTR